jgi:hypothetical protein
MPHSYAYPVHEVHFNIMLLLAKLMKERTVNGLARPVRVGFVVNRVVLRPVEYLGFLLSSLLQPSTLILSLPTLCNFNNIKICYHHIACNFERIKML